MRRDAGTAGAPARAGPISGGVSFAEVRPFRWTELSQAPSSAEEAPDAEPVAAAPPPPSAEEVREALLARARDEAEALLAGARREAEALCEAARSRGLEEGRREARAELAAAAGRWQAAAEELAAFKPRLLEPIASSVRQATAPAASRARLVVVDDSAGGATGDERSMTGIVRQRGAGAPGDQAWIASSVIRRAWIRQITRVSRPPARAGR